ncbi:MAG: DUF1987 domain-containing protein [Bacteroidales bacterium]|nr:DUF1987 domain-containing protein [Bacteroidales bacterium]
MENNLQKKVVDIQMTEDTPRIILDERKSIFSIEGPSYPEDAFTVYTTVLEWIKNTESKFVSGLECKFKFKVISSASHKMIYEILIELEKLYKGFAKIKILWFYEKYDEDMLEVGEDFSDTIDLPFEFIPY